MADQQVGVQLGVKGVPQAVDAFKKVGQSAQVFDNSTKSLTSSLTKLGIAGAVLYGLKKSFDFLKSTTQDALDQAKILQILNGAIASVGLSLEEAKPKVDAFAKSMLNMGVDDDLTYASITRLLKTTGDLDKAMKMSKLASDLASSGIGDYASNTEGLNRILLGVGTRALIQFGVHLDSTATVAEQVNAVMKKVTQTTEEYSQTAQGQLSIATTQWKKFREEMGTVGAITLVNLSNAFTTTYNKIGQDTSSLAKKIAEFFNVTLPGVGTTFLETFYVQKLEGLENPGIISKLFDGLSEEERQREINNVKAQLVSLEELRTETKNKFNLDWDNLLGTTGKSPMPYEPPEEVDPLIDKITKAFESLGKSITTTIETSIGKITDLRKEIKQLSEDTNKAVSEQESAHQKDLENLARSTQSKIDNYDKQIEEIRKTRQQGWRGEIIDLEAEKQKEVDVLERIGKEGIAVSEEATKDELTLLEEANAEKIQSIKDEANVSRLEKEKAIAEEQLSITTGASKVLGAGGLSSLVTAEMNTPAWQTSPSASIFNINIEGTVTSEGELLKKIRDALNRASELKEYGGTK
jgi:hypothetical protein